MSNTQEYENVLKVLSGNSSESNSLLKILDAELSLPNIPMPTLGGEVFWDNIAEYGGWKLQQNMFTHHARILDSNNIRIAWGTINGMEKAMDRMVRCLHKYDSPHSQVPQQDRLGSLDELKKLKELLDIGAITQEEFSSKKVMEQSYLEIFLRI